MVNQVRSHRVTLAQIEGRRLSSQIHAAVFCSSEKPCHSVPTRERAFAGRTQTCSPILSPNERFSHTDRSAVAKNERAAWSPPQ